MMMDFMCIHHIIMQLDITTGIFGVDTKLECSCMTLSASRVLSARSTETINWTLSIKGNVGCSFCIYVCSVYVWL